MTKTEFKELWNAAYDWGFEEGLDGWSPLAPSDMELVTGISDLFFEAYSLGFEDGEESGR